MNSETVYRLILDVEFFKQIKSLVRLSDITKHKDIRKKFFEILYKRSNHTGKTDFAKIGPGYKLLGTCHFWKMQCLIFLAAIQTFTCSKQIFERLY